jgi:hypothetical protein
MPTTITLDPDIRDRLKRYGHAGMTYNDILRGLMDRFDEQEFVAEMRRMAAEADERGLWVDLDETPED